MIDATTIKVGDKVRLRNGEVQIVTECRWHYAHETKYPVVVNGTSYTSKGFYSQLASDYDILEIIPVEASTSIRDGLGSHSHSFISEEPKGKYVWKATVQYHGSKDGGWSREINEVHYFTDPTCMESLSKLAFDNYGSITVERYELLQQKD